MLFCDSLKFLPYAVLSVCEKTILQICIFHLLLYSFKYSSKRDYSHISKDLNPLYTSSS